MSGFFLMLVVALLKKTAEAAWFTNFITIIIIVAGVLVGLETYKSITAEYGTILHVLDQIVLYIFVLEIIIKMGSEGSRPWRYFLDPWNVFDFLM